MQRKLDFARRSDEELIKESGLILDFDEIARKGSMTREETAIAKWYGIYSSRQAGTHMARVVIPGGRMTSTQVRALAKLASRYSLNRLSFTTRQSAQFHRLKVTELAALLRDLHAAGLSTFHGCGDVTRNVAACSWAPICPHRRFDVLPHAQATSAFLSDCRDLDNLPRKFKITFSGCPGDCGQPSINCIGLTAIVRRRPDGGEEQGFRVRIGGGLGWRAFLARELFSFVPADRVTQVCRAVGLLFRDHGDRQIRMYARLKFVVDRLGIEECRRIVCENLDRESVNRGDFEVGPAAESGEPVPPRPQRRPDPCGNDGRAIQQIMIPKGEIEAPHLLRIAELAEIYGDKCVYSSNRQNLEIHGVDPARLSELRQEIAKLGLRTDGFHGLRDVVACVGTTYCPLAVGCTHDMFDRLQSVVHQEKYGPIRDRVLVHISGCPNSCSQFQIGDIGLRGLRIREKVGSTEAYRIVVGGDLEHFGQMIGDFKVDDCVRVVTAILDTFLDHVRRTGAEDTLAGHVRLAGLDPYRQAVDRLAIRYDQMAENPLELSVFTGQGRTAMDLATNARDIPCQAACPANTHVPEYIRHIAHGRFEEAHRINQEDNVLPNILGRVCTRPCEARCRYQWTSTRGQVRICHLKRSAADHKPQPSRPLPTWFGPSGKRVAIVGAGPAGLAAARELKRYGHEVTVFEREGYVGGQIAMGIPRFRLPQAVIDEDFAAILDSGIEVRLAEPIDRRQMGKLLETHDAVLLAVGANRPHTLRLPGLPEGLAIEGLRFMKHYNEGRPMPVTGDVVVIGGGFTAVDCARSARRLVGRDGRVSIMYRRGQAQMAATEEEHQALREESIRVETLVTPVSATASDGRIESLTFERNVLGEPDAGGKPRFIPIPGSHFTLPCRTLILAIGQTQEWDALPDGVELAGGHATSSAGLFVAGDFASGSGDIIHSVASGKQAADEVDTFLTGRRRRETVVEIQQAPLTGRTRDHDLVYPQAVPMLDPQRRAGNEEVELGLSTDAGREHAWRCYLCNHKFEIDQDKCIHCDWCIRVSPRDCIRRLRTLDRDERGQPVKWEEVPKDREADTTYIWIDSDNCIRCGNCISVCPVDAISLRQVGQATCSSCSDT